MVELLPFEELMRRSKHPNLLLGSGFSSSCDACYSYPSLFRHARKNLFTRRIERLFQHLGENNFEAVLRFYDSMCGVLPNYYSGNTVVKALREEHTAVKTGLIRAISEVHLASSNQIHRNRKKVCGRFIRRFNNIFTTNYDLLLYWVERYEFQGWAGSGKHDGFWFDVEHPNANNNYLVFDGKIGNFNGMYFLHGALHLYRHSYGTRKRKFSKVNVPLIKQIKDDMERQIYPLFVAEGDYSKKMEQIVSSDYLHFCYRTLEAVKGDLFTYGFSFNHDQDWHISEAIANNNDIQKLVVGIYVDPNSPGNRRQCLELVARVQSIIDTRKAINKSTKARIDKARRLDENVLEPRLNDLSLAYFDTNKVRLWDAS